MSLFYAELVRLKMILDEIREGRPAFFLIDEMLRGTNAQDRHKGSLALMRQLLKAGATGIVATHDLDLTALAAARVQQMWGRRAARAVSYPRTTISTARGVGAPARPARPDRRGAMVRDRARPRHGRPVFAGKRLCAIQLQKTSKTSGDPRRPGGTM